MDNMVAEESGIRPYLLDWIIIAMSDGAWAVWAVRERHVIPGTCEETLAISNPKELRAHVPSWPGPVLSKRSRDGSWGKVKEVASLSQSAPITSCQRRLISHRLRDPSSF